jgi:hypothetical protein
MSPETIHRIVNDYTDGVVGAMPPSKGGSFDASLAYRVMTPSVHTPVLNGAPNASFLNRLAQNSGVGDLKVVGAIEQPQEGNRAIRASAGFTVGRATGERRTRTERNLIRVAAVMSFGTVPLFRTFVQSAESGLDRLGM